MILDVLRLEAKVKRYEGDPKQQGKQADKLEQVSTGNANEIGQLKNELAKKDKSIEALKKQCEGLQREYGLLGDQVSGPDRTPKKDK